MHGGSFESEYMHASRHLFIVIVEIARIVIIATFHYFSSFLSRHLDAVQTLPGAIRAAWRQYVYRRQIWREELTLYFRVP
jgi:hypothetical protein